MRDSEAVIKDVEAKVVAIPDFPKPGILFRDIMPIFTNMTLFDELCDVLAERVKTTATGQVQYLAGLEARGFLFGPTIAAKLGIPFVAVRKRGKLPGEILTISYDLEYGTDSIEIQRKAVPSGAQVVVFDDLLATGGTATAAVKLFRKAGAEVIGVVFIIQLDELPGTARLAELGVPFEALLHC